MLAKAYWWIFTHSESWPNPILKAPLCPPAVNLVRFSKTVPTKGQTVDNGRRSFSTWAIPIRTTPPFEKPPINLRQRVVSRTNRSGGSPGTTQGSLSRDPFTGHLGVSWNVNQGSGPVASIGGDVRAGALCGDGGCRLALAHLVNVSGAAQWCQPCGAIRYVAAAAVDSVHCPASLNHLRAGRRASQEWGLGDDWTILDLEVLL